MELFKEILSTLVDLFFPQVCPFCQRIMVEKETFVCQECLREIEFVNSPLCSCCGKPFFIGGMEDHLCGECLTEKKFYTKARGVLFYEGVVKEAIHRYKYSSEIYYARPFGWLMYERGKRYIDFKEYDLLIPVPLHKKKLMEREYNQSLLLAQEISNHTGIPVELFVLERRKGTPSQVGLKKEERERNVRGAFIILNEKKVKARRILLIDDVLSTTATVNECAGVLKKSGAERVDVLALARGRQY